MLFSFADGLGEQSENLIVQRAARRAHRRKLSERIAAAEKDIEGKYNELMTAINGVQDRLGEHATQIAELFKNYEELNQKHEALRDEFDEQVQKLADLYATVAALQAISRQLYLLLTE